MGLIKAQTEAARYGDFFRCESFPSFILIRKGSGASGDFISDGAGIEVADRQAALIVEEDKIIEFAAEPGSFVFQTSYEPSCFTGANYKGMLDSFKKKGGKFTYGGDPNKKQRVYYFNMEKITDVRFGTPVTVKYDDPYYKMELDIRFYGHYVLRICDPILLFSSVADSLGSEYTCDALYPLTSGEFMPALRDALGAAANQGVKFTDLASANEELTAHVCETLNKRWAELYGLEVTGVSIDGVSTDEYAKAKIREIDDYILRVGADADVTEAHAVHMDALKKATNGEIGSFSALMAMGTSESDDGEKKPWICPECKSENTGKFCTECGYKHRTR